MGSRRRVSNLSTYYWDDADDNGLCIGSAIYIYIAIYQKSEDYVVVGYYLESGRR